MPWLVERAGFEPPSDPLAGSRNKDSAGSNDAGVIAILGCPPDILRFAMVERAGFEPAYACAGRFTVCCL